MWPNRPTALRPPLAALLVASSPQPDEALFFSAGEDGPCLGFRRGRPDVWTASTVPAIELARRPVRAVPDASCCHFASIHVLRVHCFAAAAALSSLVSLDRVGSSLTVRAALGQQRFNLG